MYSGPFLCPMCRVFFFFTGPTTTKIYTLSLHDALPISLLTLVGDAEMVTAVQPPVAMLKERIRSEEHTSELQSPYDLVCRLLLEKKKHYPKHHRHPDHRDKSPSVQASVPATDRNFTGST